MTIVLIIIAYIAICLFEITRLIEKKYWREIGIFIAFLIPAFVLSILQGAGVKLPQLIPAITKLVETVLPGIT